MFPDILNYLWSRTKGVFWGPDEELRIVYLQIDSVVLYIVEGYNKTIARGCPNSVRGINNSAACVRCIESEQNVHHVYSGLSVFSCREQ